MARRSIHDTVRAAMSIVPAVQTGDANGTGVDTKGFEAVEFVWLVGNSGDTLSGSVYAELECEESDDNSTFTDCANADIDPVTSETTNNTGTIALINAPTEDQKVFRAAYIGSKRYVRPVYNITGTHTNGTPVGCCVLLARYRHPPVANP